MDIQPQKLRKESKILTDYRKRSSSVLSNFHYDPYDPETYSARLQDLKQRSYKRNDLADILKTANEKWGAPAKTLQNIERLRDDRTVVVVGGQQAGLLTGPLYTIYKMITVILLAQQYERSLKVPVVPVFWIAGEDHDFDEVNHIMMPEKNRMKKYKIGQVQTRKQPVSSIKLDQDQASSWLKRLFQKLDETPYTKELYDQLQELLNESETMVDYFSKIVFHLFSQGIVLLDSNDPDLRRLETDYFIHMIEHREEIATGVTEAIYKNAREGYFISLDCNPNDAHLFYLKDGERILLQVDGEGRFVGKNQECVLTKEELKQRVVQNPSCFSNNVVTRPVMQEYLLPVLAFVVGPGEVSYCSALKPAFESLHLTMPPVIPRISFTIIDRRTEKWLRQLGLNSLHAVTEGVAEDKLIWLKKQISPPVETMVDHLKLTIEKAHRPLKELARDIQADLGEIAEKNLFHIFQQIDYLEQRIFHEQKVKHERTLQKFDWLEVMLHPEGGLQERSWNILYFLNHYGKDWINEIADQELNWEEEHYFVYF
ncbi:bacillithiol biosynthesis cysteine-adding enzyme BshC [Melghiribacillus thermohalophilus]|uniref:Putative cysteine ligase BshC n=1 Tax=Melghiribacillus thermohalophilus TaxID=1324956 RepID=A0A4R3NB62_9BACI|nr:bacillithiol biosynthesis cysteine-adding enzyme BshC [Melghiribacillus thermohalophilus]TCT26879.1 bacillithiol biosynthesis cysteine-adding enzyme BshC [Melghiribacillus thermohalophilus]